jgi:hypothetical protein
MLVLAPLKLTAHAADHCILQLLWVYAAAAEGIDVVTCKSAPHTRLASSRSLGV